MDPALAWAILGLALVITELVTGTFYLLMLALASFGAGAMAWFGHAFPVQSVVAAVVAAAGSYGVHLYSAKTGAAKMAPLDVGMPANFERWIAAGASRARMGVRGATSRRRG